MGNIKKIQNISKINEDKLRLLAVNGDFLKQIESSRKTIGIPLGGYNEENDSVEVSKLYNNPDKVYLIQPAVEETLKKFGLSTNYEMSIRLYILYNKFGSVPLNHSIDLKGDYLSIKIYKKPTKEEWILIKKEVNSLISTISKNKYKFLNKFSYPDGTSVSKPKPKLERNIEILQKSSLLGKKIEPINELDKVDTYSDADIEAEVFPEVKTAQSFKNIGNIRVVRNRYKRYIKGTT